jgi:hypothetical protein
MAWLGSIVAGVRRRIGRWVDLREVRAVLATPQPPVPACVSSKDLSDIDALRAAQMDPSGIGQSSPSRVRRPEILVATRTRARLGKVPMKGKHDNFGERRKRAWRNQ